MLKVIGVAAAAAAAAPCIISFPLFILCACVCFAYFGISLLVSLMEEKPSIEGTKRKQLDKLGSVVIHVHVTYALVHALV